MSSHDLKHRACMDWEYIASETVYKNHYLSSKIRDAAVANAICAQFLRPEPGYGKGALQEFVWADLRLSG